MYWPIFKGRKNLFLDNWPLNMRSLHPRHTDLGRQITWAAKVCTMASNCGSFVYLMFFSPFWCLEFWFGPWSSENMCTIAPPRLETPFNEPAVTERSISDECEFLTGFCVENMKRWPQNYPPKLETSVIFSWKAENFRILITTTIPTDWTSPKSRVRFSGSKFVHHRLLSFVWMLSHWLISVESSKDGKWLWPVWISNLQPA